MYIVPNNSEQIYKDFVVFLEQHFESEGNKFMKSYGKFHNRHISKGFVLHTISENHYMIGFSFSSAMLKTNRDLELLMNKNVKLITISDKVQFASAAFNVAIYLQCKTTFMDVLKLLSMDHPEHRVFLINGFKGWDELNDELFHHETCFLDRMHVADYKLDNITHCGILQLDVRDVLYSDFTGLNNTIFNIVKMMYTPSKSSPLHFLKQRIASFNSLLKNYRHMEIICDSLVQWNECYEENCISNEFINKVISLKILDESEGIYNSKFLNRLLSSSSLTYLECELKIQNSNDMNILKSILGNEYLNKVKIKILSSSNMDCFKMGKMCNQISDSIEHLELITYSLKSIQWSLYFTPLSGLKYLRTTFPIIANINLFNQLTSINLLHDDTIKSCSKILNINNGDNLLDILCNYENIHTIEMNSYYQQFRQPNLNTCLGLCHFEMYYINDLIVNSDNIKNIQQNKIRTKSLLDYSK